MTVLAHAAHSLSYAGPIVLMLVVLTVMAIREGRRAGGPSSSRTG